MQRRWVTAFAPGLLALAVSGPARGDAVPTPIGTCPPGARGASAHLGTWCEPTTCQTDLDCEKNANFWEDRDIKKVCREQALCVESRTENRRSDGSTGTPFTREIAHGVCGVETSCSSPSTCQAAKRCVIPPPPKEPLLGCSLHAAGGASGLAVLAAGALLVAAGISRGRRRAR